MLVIVGSYLSLYLSSLSAFPPLCGCCRCVTSLITVSLSLLLLTCWKETLVAQAKFLLLLFKSYSFPQRPAPLIISYASMEVMHLGTVKDVGASRVQFRQFRVRPDFLAQTVADHSTCSASFFCLSLFFLNWLKLTLYLQSLCCIKCKCIPF